MPGANKRSFMKEHMFARKSNVCSCSNDRMFLHIKNKCSIQPRTFVRKPVSRNRNVCSGIKNICSEFKANICSEHLFRLYTTIRTYILYALNDVPCFPRMLFVKIAKNPAESLALCSPFFCEISIDFPCMKWYNVSG